MEEVYIQRELKNKTLTKLERWMKKCLSRKWFWRQYGWCKTQNFHITNVELLWAQIQKNYVHKTVDDMCNTLQ